MFAGDVLVGVSGAAADFSAALFAAGCALGSAARKPATEPSIVANNKATDDVLAGGSFEQIFEAEASMPRGALADMNFTL